VAFNGYFISRKNLINIEAGMRTYLELLLDLKVLQLKLKTSHTIIQQGIETF